MEKEKQHSKAVGGVNQTKVFNVKTSINAADYAPPPPPTPTPNVFYIYDQKFEPNKRICDSSDESTALQKILTLKFDFVHLNVYGMLGGILELQENGNNCWSFKIKALYQFRTLVNIHREKSSKCRNSWFSSIQNQLLTSSMVYTYQVLFNLFEFFYSKNICLKDDKLFH